MSARSVDRIPAPSGEVFRAEYMRPQRPVILQGLFAGQDIDRIRTEEEARATFGNMPLPIHNEYLTSLAEPASTAEIMTLAAYLDFVRENPATRKMCSEKPTPPDLLKSFQLPAYDRYEDAISSFFVGNAGNFAHLHFDGDYRHVLFYQVFGTKRFILIPPPQGQKIAAIGNNAFWCLENFTEEDKRQFVEFVGGYECMLHPGETLYMPACIWHYVEYTTNCMSYNLRFGRNRYTRFFAQSFHMNTALQNIAWKMVDEDVAREKYQDAFDELAAANRQDYPTAQEKQIAIQCLLDRLCAQISPSFPPREYGLSDTSKLREVYRQGSEQLYRPTAAPQSALA
jgi:lysine-specific demethylase 8